MTVTLSHKNALTPITILTTYAPHKGYSAQERKKHWDQVDNTIQQIPKRHMTIWCTDSNGQLGKDNQDNKNKHIIGPYTNAKETEKGNGQRLYNTCKTYNLIPMNTWKRPNLTKEEKQYIKNPAQPGTTEQKLTKIQQQKTITWASLNNKINRQIDYILINQRFRNCIRKAQTITGWKANMLQEKQHNVIYMQICVKLMRNYRKNAKPETGTEITYNIQDLRLYPEKLTKHMELKEETYEYQKEQTPQQNWGKIEKKLQTALITLYPHTHTKTQQQKDQDWINKQKTWSNADERQTMEYLINQRRNLQKRLEQLTRREKAQQQKIFLEKMIYLWQQKTQQQKNTN